MKSTEKNNDQRMLDIIKKMSQSGVAMRDEEETLSENKNLKGHSERFKRVSTYNPLEENLAFTSKSPMTGGVGETVNSMIDTADGSSYSKLGDNTAMPAVNAGVTAKEALELSIKRTMDSGAPINSIGFYDEINWNLEKMGYPSKLPLDVKSALNDMLKYGEIRNS